MAHSSQIFTTYLPYLCNKRNTLIEGFLVGGVRVEDQLFPSIILKNVLYVFGFTINLLSMNKIFIYLYFWISFYNYSFFYQTSRRIIVYARK